jgi:hypothetical protein
MRAKALFPGYMFAWVTDQWRDILYLINVHGFLRRGRTIIEVRPAVIDALRARDGPTGYIRIDGRFFIRQHVRARHGGGDLAGIYVGLSPQYKLRVLFTMLGREHRPHAHRDQEPANQWHLRTPPQNRAERVLPHRVPQKGVSSIDKMIAA